MIPHIFVVCFISLLSSIVTVTLDYFLVYRSESFISAEKEVEDLETQLTLVKEKLSSCKSVKKKKRLQEDVKRVENDIQMANVSVFWQRMKGFAATAVVMVVVFSNMRKLFDGVVVAKLPFIPFSLLHRLSHYSLYGTDYSDCCFIMIYAMASMVFKTVIQKALGMEPKNAKGILDTWKESVERQMANYQ